MGSVVEANRNQKILKVFTTDITNKLKACFLTHANHRENNCTIV